MTISDEAVEAATDALQKFALTEDRDGLQAWHVYARAALEAAAPHLMADAWDDAMQDADDEGYLYAHQSDAMKARNPYRAAGVGE